MMMGATTLIYLDRQAVGLLAPLIQRELGIGNEGLGWVFSVFYYAYTLAQFGVGLLLDRYSLRWLYGGAIVLWALVCTLTGLAHSFAMLLAVRILLGLAESGNWPGAMRIVSRSLPPRERAMGNGIFTSGTSLGALLAPVLVIGVAGVVGWRATFGVLGLMGLAWFAGWVRMTRNPAMAAVWRAQGGEARPAGGWRAYGDVLRLPQFWRVFAITSMVNPVLYFFLNWLPTYYLQQHGIGPGAQLAQILTATFLGLDLGYLGCGAAVLWLTRRGLGLRVARRGVFLTATLLLCGTALVPWTARFEMMVLLIVLAVFGIGVWIAMYLTLAQEVSPMSVSLAAGLLGGSGSLAGAILMWGVGWVTQTTGSFTIPFYWVTAMAVAAAAAGWAASRNMPAQTEALT